MSDQIATLLACFLVAIWAMSLVVCAVAIASDVLS